MQNITYPNALETDPATHLISEVIYGADVFFKFSKMVNSVEEAERVTGNLNGLMKIVVGKSSQSLPCAFSMSGLSASRLQRKSAAARWRI